MDSQDLTEFREPLAALATAAGELILQHYEADTPSTSAIKADDTPVTAADLAAHELLLSGLDGFGLPVLSEESADTSVARHSWSRFWMVDPLDGTREFLERTGEFCVNIALIVERRPRLGLIHIPCTAETFFGGPGLGAWRLGSNDWDAITCGPLPAGTPPRVFTSRRHRGDRLEALLARLRELAPGVQRYYSGSAIKFCRLAEGDADLYPRFSPCSEWDTAAGQALLEGAGGAVLGLDAAPLVYNKPDTLLSPEFFAIAEPANPLWRVLFE